MQYEIVGGALVLSDETLGSASVRLRDAAREAGLSEDDTDHVLLHLGALDMEEVGAFGDRLKKAAKTVKKGVKAAAEKTVDVARAAAKSKIVQGAYTALKAAAPSPLNQMIAGAEAAVKITKAATSGGTKGKQAKALVDKAAKTKNLDPKKLEAAANAIGVKPEIVKAATALAKHGNTPVAKKAIAAAKAIEKKAAGADIADLKSLTLESDLRKKYPNARTFKSKNAAGQEFQTIVIPVS